MFIFSFFLMLFCVLWYIVGIHLHFVCRDIKDASLFDAVISNQLNLTLEDGKREVSVQDTLENCRNNMPLFKALGGEHVFNITGKFSFRDVSVFLPVLFYSFQGNIRGNSG